MCLKFNRPKNGYMKISRFTVHAAMNPTQYNFIILNIYYFSLYSSTVPSIYMIMYIYTYTHTVNIYMHTVGVWPLSYSTNEERGKRGRERKKKRRERKGIEYLSSFMI